MVNTCFLTKFGEIKSYTTLKKLIVCGDSGSLDVWCDAHRDQGTALLRIYFSILDRKQIVEIVSYHKTWIIQIKNDIFRNQVPLFWVFAQFWVFAEWWKYGKTHTNTFSNICHPGSSTSVVMGRKRRTWGLMGGVFRTSGGVIQHLLSRTETVFSLSPSTTHADSVSPGLAVLFFVFFYPII